jgi:hypothetical protein
MRTGSGRRDPPSVALSSDQLDSAWSSGANSPEGSVRAARERRVRLSFAKRLFSSLTSLPETISGLMLISSSETRQTQSYRSSDACDAETSCALAVMLLISRGGRTPNGVSRWRRSRAARVRPAPPIDQRRFHSQVFAASAPRLWTRYFGISVICAKNRPIRSFGSISHSAVPRSPMHSNTQSAASMSFWLDVF